MVQSMRSIKEAMDFVWTLSQDHLCASYPKIKSKEETQSIIEKAIHKANENIIGYYNDDRLCGLCTYFWSIDETYAQTKVFLIKENYEEVADALIKEISIQLPGYGLLVGVPFSNEEANQYFRNRNVACMDASVDTRLYRLGGRSFHQLIPLEKVTEQTMDEYALFHDKYAVPMGMYYTSNNLRKENSRFRTYLYRQNEKILGSIFVCISNEMAEVFGLFVDVKYRSIGLETILIDGMLDALYREFGIVKEIIYFVEEDSSDELQAALAAGFQIKDRYRSYRCQL